MSKYTSVDFFKLILNEKDDDFQSFDPNKDETPEEKKEPEPASEPESKEDNQSQEPDSNTEETNSPDTGDEGDFGDSGGGGEDFGSDMGGDDDFGGGDDFGDGGDSTSDTSGGTTGESDMEGDFDEKNKNLSIISLIRTSYENLELIEKRLNEIISRSKEEQDILDITSREIAITRKNVQHYLLHNSKKYNENIAFLNNIRIHIELISKNMYYLKIKRIKK